MSGYPELVLARRANCLSDLERHEELDSLLSRELPRLEALQVGHDHEENRVGASANLARAWTHWMESHIRRGRTPRAFELQGRARARWFDESIGATEPSLVELQAKLRQQKAVMLALGGVQGSAGMAFLVTPDSLSVHRFVLADMMREARAFRTAISGRGSQQSIDAIGARLATGLLPAALARLPAGIERFVVIPPALAEDLPWEAIPLPGAHARRLVVRFATHVSPSGAAWMALHERPVVPGIVVAFGDPDVQTSAAVGDRAAGPGADATRRRLPHAREEARHAAGPTGRVWLGSAATGTRFRQEILREPVIHVAAHGVILPGDASRSGLALSGPNGLVTPAEIGALRIRADLVTLSACHGDRGPAFIGEGQLGFARAFLQAGARSVLTTRWEVGDRSAARMMHWFYSGLRSGLARDESLRRARLAATAAGLPLRDIHAFVLHGAAGTPVAALIQGGRGR